jgi:hypothetical protein
MKKIILVGCNPISKGCVMSSISSVVKAQVEVVMIENKKQLEEIKNIAFEPETLIIRNHRLELQEPKNYNDFPRNKFFYKPRDNFNKR